MIPRDVGLQATENKALSRGIIGKSAPPLTEITIRKSHENSLTLFGEFLQDSAVKDKVPVLFIDEAQLLKPDMLELVRFLLNFETNTQKLLQIVLFGQNELATNLESKKELKSRMYRSALASLNRSDMENMIQFRFQIAGGEKHPFTPDGLDELYKLT